MSFKGAREDARTRIGVDELDLICKSSHDLSGRGIFK